VSTPLLQAIGIRVAYGEHEVIHGVDLSIGQGEFVAIIGPNGSGKSTLVQALAGLVPVSRGAIRFADIDITNQGPDRNLPRGLALVLQGRRIFPRMTVRENLLLGAYSHRDAAAGGVERVTQIIPELRNWMDQACASLSGGQQQLVAIARALMLQPRLLILDEPTLGLSARNVDIVWNAIDRLHDLDIAILVVEHRLAQVLWRAGKGVILVDGAVRDIVSLPIQEDKVPHFDSSSRDWRWTWKTTRS